MKSTKRNRISIFLTLIFLVMFSALTANAFSVEDLFEMVYAKDGVVQPGSYYQRYRRAEYSLLNPFFQWYYYTIKDLDQNRYFAFDLSQGFAPANKAHEGTYIMFSMVEPSAGTKFHRYEKWDITDWKASGYFNIAIPVDNARYQIIPIDDNTFHVIGSMKASDKLFFSDGTLNGNPVDPNLKVEWDLTIHRIYGWYGQQDMESSFNLMGIISWNTYAHTAEVEGYIKVGETRYDFTRTARYRAYADMNWGQNFPKGSPAIDYPWGWYYVGKANNDLSQEIGIIAGIGRNDTQIPLLGISEGRFADIRLPNGERISVREVQDMKPSPDSEGIRLVGTSSADADLVQFKVDRSDWITYSDAVGTAQVPLRQVVTIETTTKRVILDFQSLEANYNRLLYQHQDYLFSDFEGLGVYCHVTVENRIVSYHGWDLLKLYPQISYQTQYEFTSDDAGVEYGYDTSATNNPGVFD